MDDTTQTENRLAGDEGFRNKTLFITGGTGFLGKMFIEKILRTCPLVEKIYVLVRARKGKDSQTRIQTMFENPLFDLLKKTQGEEIFAKVVAIPGDISEKELSLTDADRRLITDNVEIIYHMAATTRFDLSFKQAIITNTRSTREMIQLAKGCKKLLAFIYISTAYCFPQERVLYEKAYSIPINPNDVIKLVETKDEGTVEKIGKGYMSEYPNSYTISKALAEMIVTAEMDNLPLAIMRPSLVIAILQDPVPGWTDNLYGPMGLLVAAGKGILRSMYCKPDVYADFLPVDVAANGILGLTYDYMNNKVRRIYNLTSSSEVKVTWKEIIDVGKKVVTTRMPCNWVVWYPGGSMKSSKFVHWVCVILFHYIPAIILDALIILTANKPVLWKIQRKISKAFGLLEYYTNNQWDFNNEQALEARKLMNETERKIYRVEVQDLDLEEYLYNSIHGARLYVLKEGDETLPTARRHMKIMWAVDKLVRILMWLGMAYILIRYFKKIVGYE